MIDEIKTAARSIGSCEKVNKVKGFPSLIKLMFSPQGIEFCQKNNFPSIEVFRQNKDHVKGLCVYVDTGDIDISGKKYVSLVGNTSAIIEASGVEYVHTVILMHGAKVTINASNYAVVKVVNISGGEVIINRDNTVVEL